MPTTITATRTSPATIEEVWRLLTTLDTWPGWAPVRGAELERPGDPAPDGVGAVRRLRTPLGTTREEVVALEPPHRLAYRLVSGLPLQDYTSEVLLDLAAGGAGTDITWRSTFEPAFGPIGWTQRAFVAAVVNRFADALARAAT